MVEAQHLGNLRLSPCTDGSTRHQTGSAGKIAAPQQAVAPPSHRMHTGCLLLGVKISFPMGGSSVRRLWARGLSMWLKVSESSCFVLLQLQLVNDVIEQLATRHVLHDLQEQPMTL